MRKDKQCGCSPLDNYTVCDDQQTTSSDTTEITNNTDQILPTDKLLILRKDGNQTKVYKASWSDLSPRTALFIVSRSVQAMPRFDPKDGQSLWNNNGSICIASDPVANAFL